QTVAAAFDGDVLQQADVQRVGQERMEIEQRVEPRLAYRANVAQRFLGIGVVALRLELQVEPLQTVRDGPAKKGTVAVGRCRHGQLRQQLEEPGLVGGLDDDDRGAGLQRQLQIVTVVQYRAPRR